MRLALGDPLGSRPAPGGSPGALTAAAAPPGWSQSSDPRSLSSYPGPGPPHPRPRAARPPRGPGTRPLGITWRRRRSHQPIGASPLSRAAQSETARGPGSAHAATRAGSSLSLFLHEAVRTRRDQGLRTLATPLGLHGRPMTTQLHPFTRKWQRTWWHLYRVEMIGPLNWGPAQGGDSVLRASWKST